MKVFCAWCGQLLRVIHGLKDYGVSHGICRICALCWFAQVDPVEGDPWRLWQDEGSPVG